MSFQAVDYRKVDELSTTSVELSSAALGGKVLGCSDEWFADASNLVKPHAAESLKGQFGPKGALYDGWETRRHNPTHDWALLRLGPSGGGRITGFDIDTTTFSGNEAPAVAVYGLYLEDGMPSVDDERWEQLLPRVPCGPLGHHVYAYSDPAGTRKKYTHVLLVMIPDGGISRFRVYGVVAPAPVGHGVGECVDMTRGNTLDLAHVLNGGRVVYTNDQHFGQGANILLPGRGENMGDGWETKRSRVANHYDWAVVKLAEPGVPETIEIDTIHFLGNFPESIAVDGCNYDGNVPAEHGDLQSRLWEPIVKRTQVGPGKQHYFAAEAGARKVFTHVRVVMFPDGGIKRFRLIGRRAEGA